MMELETKLRTIPNFREKTHMFASKLNPLNEMEIVVASVNVRIGDWSAYLGDILIGLSADDIIRHVAEFGTKLNKTESAMLFPSISKDYKWRD